MQVLGERSRTLFGSLLNIYLYNLNLDLEAVVVLKTALCVRWRLAKGV